VKSLVAHRTGEQAINTLSLETSIASVIDGSLLACI